jgi:predicted ester cyclase
MTASHAIAAVTTPAEEAVALFRQAIERGWNQGDLAAIDELFADDFVEHQAGIAPGREGVKGSIRFLRTAFPDLRLTVEDAAADGDRVWLRISAVGTHAGPFGQAPATGLRFRIDVIDVARVTGGRIVEHWGVADRASLAQQIGVVPAGPR